eukprot:6463300-Amphidinium_carterae.1
MGVGSIPPNPHIEDAGVGGFDDPEGDTLGSSTEFWRQQETSVYSGCRATSRLNKQQKLTCLLPTLQLPVPFGAFSRPRARRPTGSKKNRIRIGGGQNCLSCWPFTYVAEGTSSSARGTFQLQHLGVVGEQRAPSVEPTAEQELPSAVDEPMERLYRVDEYTDVDELNAPTAVTVVIRTSGLNCGATFCELHSQSRSIRGQTVLVCGDCVTTQPKQILKLHPSVLFNSHESEKRSRERPLS